MNATEYQTRINELFDRWKKAQGYTDENFTVDGVAPENWDKWNHSKPKILFLLKENWGDFEPQDGFTIKGDFEGHFFTWNIARWRHLIQTLFSDFSADVQPDDFHAKFPIVVEDCALVEAKKINEAQGTSSNIQIYEYVVKDKAYLKEQLDLLDPQIILCCYTENAYRQRLRLNDHYPELIKKSNCGCYKDGNRLVIDFYHPSVREGHTRSVELFEILKFMIKEGRVFEHFDWGKKPD